MEEIIPNLYLGSFAEVQDIKSNVSPGFVACLTVGKDFKLIDTPKTQMNEIKIGLPDLNLIGIDHIRIPIDDGTPNVICKFLPKALLFIDEHIDKGKVYVHCFAGVSRSASFVFAYLLSKGYSPIDAFELITSKRGVVRPYYRFIYEILNYFKESSIDDKMKTLSSGLYKTLK